MRKVIQSILLVGLILNGFGGKLNAQKFVSIIASKDNTVYRNRKTAGNKCQILSVRAV